ncbi:putative DNA binding domain-containing protein [Candidatus Woesearchaeota archaeon]|nr:putative DNA binding domain-containing protein [Candidatus Woesearchaeota archaeon]
MNQEKTLKLIKGGETEEVEFKESFHSTQEIAKVLCALANTDGGYLIFGLTKKGEINGIKEDSDKVLLEVANAAQSIHSPPLISTSVHMINGKKVICVEIRKANDKNAHSIGGVIYVRIGSTTRKLEGQSLFDFLKNKQILCFDETYSEANIADLDTEKIQGYLELRNQKTYLKTNTITDFIISNMLGKKNGHLKLKQVSSLFFAKDPYHWHSLEDNPNELL